jgi:signal transduction histidine kinase
MSRTDSKNMKVFLEEAKSLVFGLRKDLLVLEETPRLGIEDQQLLQEAYRKAHTLVGLTAMMGGPECTQCAKALENIFKNIRDGKTLMDEALCARLSKGIDACQQLLGNGVVNEFPELMKRLEEVIPKHPLEKEVMEPSKFKVLIVEDSLAYENLLKNILEEADLPKYKSVCVNRLSDALTLMSQEHFDIVVLDLGLPDSDGLESLKRVREQKSEVAIVVLTGSDVDLGPLAIQMGAQDYLSKGPLEAQLVLRVLRFSIERKRAELEIINKNKELETLLHVISHDLKEPLRAVTSFSLMLSNQYADRLDERGQEFLGYIVKGSQRMGQLLEDIVRHAWARKMDVPTTLVDCETIVSSALKKLETKIADTGAKIEIKSPLPVLYLDEMWAEQAIYNLILNALKYTREGEKPEVEIAPYNIGNSLGIAIRDRGPGIATEHQDRIFQLFQRLVGREIEGTGAGLAIVREVAFRHGGRAWVQARQDGGSEFVITFVKEQSQDKE